MKIGGWAARGVIAKPQGSIAVTEQTVFADMNCDDRADYVPRDPGQNNLLLGWFNLGGFDNSWSAKKLVAYGVAMSFPVEVHLADISGDGLDDYLVVDPTNGAVRAWLNRGGNQCTPDRGPAKVEILSRRKRPGFSPRRNASHRPAPRRPPRRPRSGDAQG
ncbi:hypothetical protein [Parafrankia sp. EUN1f]|uniref:hypothetical protein n=1 Tax=Parafrankia sp. EUN1f TaxID=102897 RepID=UPI0001C44E5A|nr:hypothetical protein [Parafrankia sp. EUN1f]EFC83350.1 FG-GAP repeat protein [Parafrankia sp. EUN1f]